jgi:hypothetical protein
MSTATQAGQRELAVWLEGAPGPLGMLSRQAGTLRLRYDEASTRHRRFSNHPQSRSPTLQAGCGQRPRKSRKARPSCPAPRPWARQS